MQQTHIIKLRFGRFSNLLTVWAATLPLTARSPFFVVNSPTDGHGDTEVPLDVQNFRNDFLDLMDACCLDNLFPCEMWIIKWGERCGMAAASRLIHPHSELFYVVGGQSQQIEYIGRWHHQIGHVGPGWGNYARVE